MRKSGWRRGKKMPKENGREGKTVVKYKAGLGLKDS